VANALSCRVWPTLELPRVANALICVHAVTRLMEGSLDLVSADGPSAVASTTCWARKHVFFVSLQVLCLASAWWESQCAGNYSGPPRLADSSWAGLTAPLI
jgi:hypothetical protein